MKHRARLAGVLAGLAATALAASPASAQTYDFDGYNYVFVPIHSTGSITVANVTVWWDINLDTTLCASYSLDNADPVIPEIGLCVGIGRLLYTQIVCGTGTLGGTVTMTEAGGDTDAMTVSGTMLNWIAVFTGTTSAGETVTGTAVITPAAGQNCATGITDLNGTGTWQIARVAA
jgi:hypothetical protein